MNPELLEYFHRELQFLSSQGPEFARRYPDIAPLLETPARQAADPHVERMIQALAWLNARVHLEMDSDFKHLTEAFFAIVFPHAQRPFPSCAVVQMAPRARDRLSVESVTVPRGTVLESDSASGVRCRFRTVFPVDLTDIVVQDARFQSLKADMAPRIAPQARSVLRLRLQSLTSDRGIRLGMNPRLRLFLHAPRGTAFPLYELLVRDSVGVVVTSKGAGQFEQPGRGLVSGVGFQPDERLLPQSARTPAGPSLLLEFFAFPEKHLFVDVYGLDPLGDEVLDSIVEVAIYCDRPYRELEGLISKDSVRLHCTPIVNLFSSRAEPVALTHEQAQYPVRPDVRFPDGIEVFSVDRVSAVSAEGVVRIREFYEPRRPTDSGDTAAAWIAQRQPHGDDQGFTPMRIAVADPKGEFLELDKWTLDVELTCLNANLPGVLPFHGTGPRFRLPAEPDIDVECIVPPSRRFDPPLAEHGHGKLVALLALQSLPLFCENPTSDLRLQEYVGYWNPIRSREGQAFIESLLDASARQVLEELWIGTDRCFARGVEVVVEMDESRLPGRSAFLFANVLERFLSLTSSINCFTRLVVRSSETRNTLHRSPVRAGDQVLASLT